MYVAHDGTHSAGINHTLGDGSAARLAAPPALANCSDAGDNRLQTTTQMKPPETENHAGCERGLFRVGGEVEEGVKKKKKKGKDARAGRCYRRL